MVFALLVLPIGLAATLYVHLTVGTLTPSAFQAWAVRVGLVLVGIAFGGTRLVYESPVPAWLAFAAAFGLVHVPPAAVLFIKRRRHRGG